MSLLDEMARRLATIRALLAKAESTDSPAEAESLSVKAAELMSKHSIDQAMLDAAAALSKPQATARRIVSFAGQDFVAQKQNLLHYVAEHHGCTTVVSGLGGRDPQSYVFGYQSDLGLTDMLYTSLILQGGNALIAEDIPFGETAKSFTTAWWSAYVSKIYTRLLYSRQDAESAAEKAPARHRAGAQGPQGRGGERPQGGVPGDAQDQARPRRQVPGRARGRVPGWQPRLSRGGPEPRRQRGRPRDRQRVMTSPGRPVKISNRKAALRMVTSHLVGNLQASATDELVNSVEAAGQLTRAEEERLEWAIDQVVRRLHALGGAS